MGRCGRAAAEEGRGHGSQCGGGGRGAGQGEVSGLIRGETGNMGGGWAGGDKICFPVLKDLVLGQRACRGQSRGRRAVSRRVQSLGKMGCQDGGGRHREERATGWTAEAAMIAKVIAWLCGDEGQEENASQASGPNNWASNGAAGRWGPLAWRNSSRSVLDVFEHL